MNYPLKLQFLLIIALSLFACHKKEKKRIAGTYSGVELHDGDSLAYPMTLTFLLSDDNKNFILTKETYPFTHGFSARKLIKEGSVTIKYYFPSEILTVRIKDDSLFGDFSYKGESFLFSGKKVE